MPSAFGKPRIIEVKHTDRLTVLRTTRFTYRSRHVPGLHFTLNRAHPLLHPGLRTGIYAFVLLITKCLSVYLIPFSVHESEICVACNQIAASSSRSLHRDNGRLDRLIGRKIRETMNKKPGTERPCNGDACTHRHRFKVVWSHRPLSLFAVKIGNLNQ